METIRSILNLPGPQALALFAALAVAIPIVAILIKLFYRSAGIDADRDRDLEDLGTYDIAYLADGPRGAVRAAVASLSRRGRIDLSKRSTIEATGSTDANPDPFEDEVERVSRGRGSLGALEHAAAAAARDRFEPRLVDRGLLVAAAGRTLWSLMVWTSTIAFFGLGVTKVMVGMERTRPVGFLILMMLAALVAFAALLRRPWRTHRGDHALELRQADHAALKTTTETAPDQVDAGDTALALALFGPMIVAPSVPEFAHFQRKTATGGDGSIHSCGGGGSDGGGGTDGSDGGGGSSCGGGCGGGCGGCGGCGG